MTFAEFRKKYLGKKVDWELFPAIGGSYMWLVSALKEYFGVKLGMFLSCRYLEVFNSIIRMVMVKMMDNFVGQKLSPNGLLNYFSIALTFPMRMFPKIYREKIGMALVRAKTLIASMPTWVSLKNATTVFAFEPAFPRFIVAKTTTKSSPLGWRSIKFVFTKFTSMFHLVNYTGNCMEVQYDI